MTEETEQLAIDVSKGNPGAVRVIVELLWFSDWVKMMKWCKDNLSGADLWEAYKDDFDMSVYKLGEWIQHQMSLSQKGQVKP